MNIISILSFCLLSMVKLKAMPMQDLTVEVQNRAAAVQGKVMQKVLCEHRRDDASIKCPTGYIITISYANYGNTGGEYCNTDKSIKNCQTTVKSLSIIRSKCEGIASCTVPQATNSVFGDPCYGYIKYLKIQYTCIADAESVCVLKDQDYWGSDLGGTTAFSTISQCIDNCLSYVGDRTCEAVAWRQSGTRCWPKYAVPALNKKIGIYSVNMSCIREQSKACEAGEYQNANGSCEECPINTYSSAGASNCTQCPDNKTSGEGSTSIAACQFNCSSCKAELNEVCQDGQCQCVSDCFMRGADNVCVKRFEIYTNLSLYDDAQSLCQGQGLDLAMINSEEDSSAFKAAAKSVYGDNRETRTYDTANWIWIGATDLANKGNYSFQNGDVLSFKAPWAPRQPDHKAQGEILQRYVAVSRWGEWDDSFGHYWERAFACSC